MVKMNTGSGRRLPEDPRFPLGQVVATRGAMEAIPEAEMFQALGRHERGDWGEVCTEDRAANEQALEEGSRLLSVYRTEADTRFYIITEANRSSTTVLLPDEY